MSSSSMTIYPSVEPTRFGIYEIRHLESGKRYIGSTLSSFKKRWKEHVRDLKFNRHHSPYLQRAWNKYGEQAFRISILEESEDLTYIRDREMKLILEERTWHRDIGYNLCAFEPSSTFSATARKYYAVDPEGIVHEVGSLKRFCFNNNLDYKGMRDVLKGSLHHRGWRCYRELPEILEEPNAFRERIKQARSDKVKKAKSIQMNNAACIVVDPRGNQKHVVNMKAFCEENGLNNTEMCSVKNGRLVHHNRWRVYPLGVEIPDHEEFWSSHQKKLSQSYINRMKNAKKPTSNDWIVTSPEGRIFHPQTLVIFCKEHGLSLAAMRQAHLKNRLHKGWRIEKQPRSP